MIDIKLDKNNYFDDFFTSYSYKYISYRGTSEKKAICFNKLYNDHPNVHVQISIGISTKVMHGTRHFCPLDEVEIMDWINYIRRILSFSSTIKKLKNSIIEEGWEIKVITPFNPQKVKLLTTLIRYLYEDSYPYIVWDVLQLKGLQEYLIINPINLFNIVSQVYRREPHNIIHCIHSFDTIYDPISDVMLMGWETSTNSLNNLGVSRSNIKVKLNKDEVIHLYPFSTEKFIEEFPKRKAIYDRILKVFKQTFGI